MEFSNPLYFSERRNGFQRRNSASSEADSDQQVSDLYQAAEAHGEPAEHHSSTSSNGSGAPAYLSTYNSALYRVISTLVGSLVHVLGSMVQLSRSLLETASSTTSAAPGDRIDHPEIRHDEAIVAEIPRPSTEAEDDRAAAEDNESPSVGDESIIILGSTTSAPPERPRVLADDLMSILCPDINEIDSDDDERGDRQYGTHINLAARRRRVPDASVAAPQQQQQAQAFNGAPVAPDASAWEAPAPSARSTREANWTVLPRASDSNDDEFSDDATDGVVDLNQWPETSMGSPTPANQLRPAAKPAASGTSTAAAPAGGAGGAGGPLFGSHPLHSDYNATIAKFYLPHIPTQKYSLVDSLIKDFQESDNWLADHRTKQELVTKERISETSRIRALSQDQQDKVYKVWRASNPSMVVSSAFQIDITCRDLQTLCDGQWLNDNVIDFYLNLVTSNAPSVFCWTTHFFTTLQSKGYPGVARWSKRKKLNVTQKALILVPINIMGTHWALAAVNNTAREFQYYDSLSSSGNIRALQQLQTYMIEESKKFPDSKLDFHAYKMVPLMDTPQQSNGYDCGVFTCTSAAYVAKQQPLSFGQRDMKLLRRKMAYEILTKELT